MARRISDVAMKIALPLTAYRGVAIRIVPGMTEDEDRVAVVLSHADAALEVPLYEADDDENVIAEWRLWASTLGLPLLMEGMDGHTVAAENRLGEIEVDRPASAPPSFAAVGPPAAFPDPPPDRQTASGAVRASRRARNHFRRTDPD